MYLNISIISTLIALVFTVLYIRKFIDYKKIYYKYKDVIDLDLEITRYSTELNDLREKYKNSRTIYLKLKEEVSILEDDLDMIEFGVYKSHFDFDTSEHYKNEIKVIRAKQKQSIKDKSAIVCSTTWEVGGKKSAGTAMVNQYKRLMLRAFNNECDASILKVRWNNISTMEKRIEKAFSTINKMGVRTNIEIQNKFLELKLTELRLAFEYQEKKQYEKEEQREIREQMREEAKVFREIEKAKKDAELDEKALDKAKKELEKVHGEESLKLQKHIEILEQQLQDKERAISRAQLTKTGHVYVISNLGSFGENIYKIGLTRRLEPMIRVKELGDASVPFQFDVHAMIFSENAPELEKTLHHEFEDKRVNLINKRKEYFNTSLTDIESVVHKHDAEIIFTKIAEAKEYYQTLKLIEEKSNRKTIDEIISEEFPEELD